jgi:polyisoprenoid-binding protein YceI
MSGDLTVRTTTRPVTWDVEARIEDDTLYAAATTLVKMTQFGFQPPSLTILRVEDDVTLTLNLVAPAVASGETTPSPTPP